MFYYKINYQIGSILTLASTLFFGFLIFLRGRGGRIVRTYFMLMLATAAWALGIFGMLTATDRTITLLWARFLHIGASFVPVLYFRFVIKLIGLENKQKRITQLGYLLAFIFSVLFLSPYLIKSVSFKLGMNYADPAKAYPLFILYFLVYPLYASYLSCMAYDKLSDLGKRQLIYVTIAACLGFLGGGSTFFSCYGKTVPIAGPLALYLVACSNLFVAIATYTARLMDVELIKRRTLTFSLLYGASVGIFVFMVFAGQRLLSQNFNINRWILPSIALFAITVFIRPLENFLVKITDKVLYQRRYDYMITLKNAAKGMTLITDTKKLLGLMVRILSKEVRLTGCAIYIYDKEAAVYNRAVNRGFKDAETIEVVHKDSPLIDWLIEKKQPINYDSIATWIQSERIFPHQVVLKKTLEQIRVIMKRLVGSLCVPSFLRGEMIGFLVLGAKLSGDRYSADDTLLMLTLANSAAIAIENARMYAELKEKITRLNQMYEGEHLLFIDAASAFSYAIDTKDGYSHMHSLKVSDYALALTKELEKILPHMHFEKHFYDILQITSLLHDVGKIGVSDKILNKQANLTKEEEEELRKHAIKGEVILRPMKEIEEVFDLIRHHHEHYDGTGYPDHLKESEIPLISRIVAVANAYDTMTSDRPYRKAIPKKEALEELKQGAGKQFDPFVVDALVKALS